MCNIPSAVNIRVYGIVRGAFHHSEKSDATDPVLNAEKITPLQPAHQQPRGTQ